VRRPSDAFDDKPRNDNDRRPSWTGLVTTSLSSREKGCHRAPVILMTASALQDSTGRLNSQTSIPLG
jgi:hypothetical protein